MLVARHENDITGTTDVADHPEFADRRTTKTIDGKQVTGWFTEDFTLEELKTLRAKERLPQVRPAQHASTTAATRSPPSPRCSGWCAPRSARTGRTIGVAPETKHPTYFDSIGLSPEEPMLRTLKRFHLDDADAKVLIQSFEVGQPPPARHDDRRSRSSSSSTARARRTTRSPPATPRRTPT